MLRSQFSSIFAYFLRKKLEFLFTKAGVPIQILQKNSSILNEKKSEFITSVPGLWFRKYSDFQKPLNLWIQFHQIPRRNGFDKNTLILPDLQFIFCALRSVSYSNFKFIAPEFYSELKGLFSRSVVHTTEESLLCREAFYIKDFNQGDQIGLTFVYWVTVYFGRFKNYRSRLIFGLLSLL
jgi:hypothetical protein